MIVLQSTHDRLQVRYDILKLAFGQLQKKWNALVERINAKGGEAFLNGKPANVQFDKEELRTLVKLCHPDKHGGSKEAEEITKKLLTLYKP